VAVAASSLPFSTSQASKCFQSSILFLHHVESRLVGLHRVFLPIGLVECFHIVHEADAVGGGRGRQRVFPSLDGGKLFFSLFIHCY